MSDILLQTNDLKKYFEVKNSFSSSKTKKGTVKAVDNININIMKGTTTALVGESGCGKSTLGRTIINLIKPSSGEVLFNGKNIYDLSNDEEATFRKETSIIFQDPYASLNPRMKVRDIIGEPLLTNGVKNKKERLERVFHLMDICGLKIEYEKRYPHQFSGGQRQRIGIARALALNPSFIVCDEPVSALDVSIQAQILNLLKELQSKFDLTYLFISHDLSVVRYISDTVYVMYLGKIVESGTCKQLFESPKHPYTKFLMSAVPIPDPNLRDRTKDILEGDIPSSINPPSGCRFNTRCPYVQNICREKEPKLIQQHSQSYACHFPLQ